MNIHKRRLMLLLVLTAMSVSAAQGQAQVLAIKAGKILPIVGDPITDGIILIENEKITAIGTDVAIPEGAEVIDATDSVVMPGLVDARGPQPVRGDLNEQSEEITPTFHISQALNPKDKELKRRLQSGTTTLYVSPGNANTITGLGVVIKPTGKTPRDMILKDEAALHIIMGYDSTRGNRIPYGSRPSNFYYRRPTTGMAVNWMLRKSFFDAQQYMESHEQEDPALEVLSKAIAGELPIRVTARRAIDIRTAFRIADEYGLKIIVDECTEGYKVTDLIAEKEAPVVAGPFYYYPQNYSQYSEGREFNWNNAGILAEAGVKVALASGAETETPSLLEAAVLAVRHGMSRDEALRAITMTPAEILGVADRVGSLKAGADADILILNGDPLADTSRPTQVILNGRTVYRAK